MNLEFKHAAYWVYAIIPVLGLTIYILAYRKKRNILHVLNLQPAARFQITRIVLSVLGLSLIVVALLGPQLFKGTAVVKKYGLDIYFLIDTSASMLVEDIRPDRISRAKKIMETIIDQLEGDRVGFIPFSSDAYVQMPLTDDYRMADMFLNVIDTQMIGGGGTNIEAAIRLASRSFGNASSADKVILILSDGEEHQANSVETLKQIRDDRLKVFAVGIGSEQGGFIPVYDATGERRIDYKKDAAGNLITSALQPDKLKSLADYGNGRYYQATLSGDEIQPLLRELSALKRGDTTSAQIKRYMQLYQYFLGAGILLFVASYLLPTRRRVS